MKPSYLLVAASWLLIIISGTSCNTASRRAPVSESPVSKKLPTTSVSYQPKAGLTPASSISIQAVAGADSITIDSVVVFAGEKKLTSAEPTGFELSLDGLSMGSQSLAVRVYRGDGQTDPHAIQLTVYASEAPTQYAFRKVETFTHDPDAYTQGLVYHNGTLYESTGTRGESSLREVELATGKVLRQINLDDKYFGEGLAVLDGHLIQLTWTSHTGFVYDIETFEQLKTFNYPTEGWGLAVIGNELVMSDGTENLYFLDPATFTEKRRVQVYDHEKKITSLNELEVVNGLVYANVYQTDTIVIIDPRTGAVTGEINLAGIFNKDGYGRRIDVLNGIAWDEQSQHIFVTGKWWPKLYEIELIDISL